LKAASSTNFFSSSAQFDGRCTILYRTLLDAFHRKEDLAEWRDRDCHGVRAEIPKADCRSSASSSSFLPFSLLYAFSCRPEVIVNLLAINRVADFHKIKAPFVS